jgi:hypothetical protein
MMSKTVNRCQSVNSISNGEKIQKLRNFTVHVREPRPSHYAMLIP